MFSRLSIVSVDGKQHSSEVVFNALFGFNWRLAFGFRAVSVHPGLVTSDYGVHEIGVPVYGVQHVLGVNNSSSSFFLLKYH